VNTKREFHSTLAMSEKEAQFLASQRARTEERLRRRGERDRARTEALLEFWAEVRSALSEWRAKLEQLLATKGRNGEGDDGPVSESEKRRIHLQLDELKQQLWSLRKSCLSSSSSSSAGENPASVAAIQNSVPLAPDDLPMSDLRILHEEFAKHQSLLDGARKTLLPKGKFVFARYRKAWQEQQELEQQMGSGKSPNGSETDDGIGGAINSFDRTSNPRQEIPTRTRTIPKDCIHDIAGARVVVDCLGRIRVSELENENEGETRGCHSSRQPGVSVVDEHCDHDRGVKSIEEETISSPVLQNIQDSTIELHGSSYKSVHLLDVVRSTVVIANVVEGAVHVTGCHHTRLQLGGSCQQLRMHESTRVQCCIGGRGVMAGAILEGCRRIQFFVDPKAGNDGDHPALDVKDFNFLKKGVPSPNYTIEWNYEGNALRTEQFPASTANPLHTTENPLEPMVSTGKGHDESATVDSPSVIGRRPNDGDAGPGDSRQSQLVSIKAELEQEGPTSPQDEDDDDDEI